MKTFVVILACLSCLICSSWAYIPRFSHGRPRGGMLGTPARRLTSDPLPPDMWMEQTLDHFNDADTRTWQQRYFANDKYFNNYGPVFLMIGGEGEASPIWMVEGMWTQYAKTHNAMLFQLEHRFYGKSHPTSDMSDDNLTYLSSEQALADLAAFIQLAKGKYNLQTNSWVTFGGSYPGSLAAWFRLKYPHLVVGSVSSSAPLLAILDFKDYMGVVRDSLAMSKAGSSCDKMVQEATAQVELALQTQEGRNMLKTNFNLCDDIDPSNSLDISNLFETLSGNFAGVVQYNNDNRAFEGGVGSNITIDILCGIMTDTTIPKVLDRYAKVNKLMLDTYGEKCQDFVYSKMIDSMKSVDWNSSASEGGRQWTYQTCTEFAFFQSSDLQDQPFGHMFSVNFSIQQCMDIYGSKFNQDLIMKGINRTNTNYGDRKIKVTNIVFVNGSIDPWHALGLLFYYADQSTAIYINGTAHCANMYPPRPSDLPQLTAARQQIEKYIGQWVL